MKKLFYLFLTGLFLTLGANCANMDNFNVKPSGTMPSDEEIWQVIRQFGVDKSQEQQVFAETKKSLNELYKNAPSEPVVKKTNRSIQADKPHVVDPSLMMKGRKKERFSVH